MELPLHLKIFGYILRLISNRWVVVITSILLIISGYLVDCYYTKATLLSPNSAIITALGLILTIKHHYLANIVSLLDLAKSNHQEAECSPGAEQLVKDPDYVSSLLVKATDEGIGLLLILIGTSLNAFGSFIPLISLCP
jgi:hypothetical protein